MRWIPEKINPIFRTKSAFLLISVSQSVDVHPPPQINESVEEAELDLFVVHLLMPLSSVALTYTKFTLNKTSFKYTSALPVFHRHKVVFFLYFIFQKAALCKRLEQSLRPCECYFKAFMQFLNAYFSNKPSDIVTSLPNQGPYPESLEVWEASCLTTVGVAPCPWMFWGFSS